MTGDEQAKWLDEIAGADVNGLRKIMLRLEDMPDSPEVAELHSLATDSMYSLCGAGGDY